MNGTVAGVWEFVYFEFERRAVQRALAAAPAGVVITSYSIHYTKLYEKRRRPRHDGGVNQSSSQTTTQEHTE